MRKAEFNIAEGTKQKIADGILRGLFNAKVKCNEDRLEYKNGQGLFNLNHIFSSLERSMDANFLVNSFKRGSYKFAIIYDVVSKTLMTLASGSTLDRLRSRSQINTCHYIDALLTLNDDFEGDCVQDSFFSLLEEPIPDEKREELCEEIIAAWKSNEIQKYVLVEYTIDHTQFSLNNLTAHLFSDHFIEVGRENWFKYIRANYDSEIIDNTPAKLTEEINAIDSDKLDIKLKIKKMQSVG